MALLDGSVSAKKTRDWLKFTLIYSQAIAHVRCMYMYMYINFVYPAHVHVPFGAAGMFLTVRTRVYKVHTFRTTELLENKGSTIHHKC